MTTAPPYFVQQEAPASSDRLTELRTQIALARDLEQQKADLEEAIKLTTQELQTLYFKTLPDLFDELGIATLALEPEGNHPGVTAQAKPFYRAGIAASWPEDRRQQAFAYLAELGSEDLIKTKVEVMFPRGNHEQAKAFANEAARDGLAAGLKEEVHAQTLTAWLRDQVENHGFIPDLDRLGATVGRQVSLRESKK